MIKVFNSAFDVTQKFGVNYDYYKQFGLAGHEGLDIVPTTSDWKVYSLPYSGIVVKDIDMGDKGGAYGIHDTIWYPDINEAWMYCHFSSNRVYYDQEIPPVFEIGTMGNTGNTTGAHLHINRFQVDSRGYRLNKDNGYLGGIDPLPFLQQDVGETEPPTEIDEHREKGIALLDAYRSERGAGPEGNYESYVAAVIGSDRDLPNVRINLTNAQTALTTQKEECVEEKKALRTTLNEECTVAKEQLVKDWKVKVAEASKGSLWDYETSELLNVGIAKLFGRKKPGGGEQH